MGRTECEARGGVAIPIGASGGDSPCDAIFLNDSSADQRGSQHKLYSVSSVAANASGTTPSPGTTTAALLECWARVEQRHAELACPVPLR